MDLFLEIYLIIKAIIKFETIKQAVVVVVLLEWWELKFKKNNSREGDYFLGLTGLINNFFIWKRNLLLYYFIDMKICDVFLKIVIW